MIRLIRHIRNYADSGVDMNSEAINYVSDISQHKLDHCLIISAFLKITN